MVPGRRLILASASPTRRAVLAAAGVAFDVVTADVDEAAIKQDARPGGQEAGETAMALARAKAWHVARAHPDALVIGADQILVCENAWFDKPATRPVLRRHLDRLAGRVHTLMTAAVCVQGEAVVWEHLEQPRLRMRPCSPAFLDRYVAEADEQVLSCVGGYQLEATGIQLFDWIEGDHTAILGLSLLPLLRFLRDAGLMPD